MTDRRMSWIVIGPSTTSMREDVRDPAPYLEGTGFIDRAAALAGVPIQHVTRTGAYFSRISANADTLALLPFVRGGGALIWIGNNEMFDGTDTPAQQLAVLEALYTQLTAAGVLWFIVFSTMPRTTSPVALWSTSSGQTQQEGAGPQGKSVELSRGIANFARARSNVILLSFPAVRSPDDYLRWLGATPRVTEEGLHPTQTGAIVMGADTKAAFDYIDAGWPTLQANMALACAA